LIRYLGLFNNIDLASINWRFTQVSEAEIFQVQDKAVPENTKEGNQVWAESF